jgi:hypothetical protein
MSPFLRGKVKSTFRRRRRATIRGVPESRPEVQPRELAPDREREAGFRGEAFTKAAWLLGLVFVAGFAIVGMVLLSRRRRQARQ